MTDIVRAFDETKVKRGTGATGGQFSAKSKAPAFGPNAKGKSSKGKGGGGNLAFDGRRGTGYGTRGGDKRVRALQEALNRLGLTDASGKKLAIDGQMGPRTTAAVKRAQRKLGLKPDGVVTPALLRKLVAAKSLGKTSRKAAAPARTPTKKSDNTARRPSERQGSRGTIAAPKRKTAAKAAPRKAAKPAPTRKAANAPAYVKVTS